MGCGASSVQNEADNTTAPLDRKNKADTKGPNNNEETITDQNAKNARPSSATSQDSGDATGHKTKVTKPRNNFSNKQSLPPIGTVPKSVAFDVGLDSNIDKLLGKRPPERLKRLQPIENAPRLTSEQLEEKLRLAEEKRFKEMEKRKQASKKSTSKMRQNLQRAQEFEKSTQKTQSVELEEKQQAAERKREAKARELEEKKRLREERARKARERAQRLKEESNELEFDVEKDENFNAVEDDSWLDGDADKENRSSLGDRVYSGGRESPHKLPGRPTMDARGFSASTTDSFDYAYQRGKGTATADTLIRANTREHDDFFDDDGDDDELTPRNSRGPES